MTQFSIKTLNNVPSFESCEVQVLNTPSNNIQQVCLNLLSTHLFSRSYTSRVLNNTTSKLNVKIMGLNLYLMFESLLLLAYANKLKGNRTENIKISKNAIILKGKDYINILEYFLRSSNLLKTLEKMDNQRIKIRISYEIKNSKNMQTTYYLLKSLGYPL
uniref:Uncharacterized protein n=1 Tax=Wildemania schizophylla TaxID=1134705 RepID=A0A068F002_WILSC|nr:hypothetical protein [Wildemania schizophylla]AID57262.1 hypothetical protein [Wildemania schizophylla]